MKSKDCNDSNTYKIRQHFWVKLLKKNQNFQQLTRKSPQAPQYSKVHENVGD